MKKKTKSPWACTMFWEGRRIKLDHPLASMIYISETIRAAREEGRRMVEAERLRWAQLAIPPGGYDRT